MKSLTLVLSTLVALIVLSGLCQGETSEDFKNIQIQNVESPAIESNQVLNREIRIPFTKKVKTNKKQDRQNRRKKGRKMKRKFTQKKKTEKRRKLKGNKNTSKSKKINKKDRKRKARKLKRKKNNSKRKNVSNKGKKSKSRKMKENKNKSIGKLKSKKESKGNQLKASKKKLTKSVSRQSEEPCDDNCQCGEICTRSKNYERQIIRLNKRSKTIQTREGKNKNFKLLANIVTSKCEANNITSYYNTSLFNCAATISAICQAPEISEDLKYNGTDGKCYNEILKFKTPSCDSNKTHPCPLELKEWINFVKFDHPECKPTNLEKTMSGTLKNCSKFGVKPCKPVETAAMEYLLVCSPEVAPTPAPSNITTISTTEPTSPPGTTPSTINQVRQTIIEENGQIVEQNDTYNKDTKEVSISVPAHGDFQEATIIMDADSGTLVTSTKDTCQIKSIPDDVDPDDINTEVGEESNTTEPITNDSETKTYTLVVDAGAATADDISKLSPTMTKECENKPIRKTEEKKVDKETFDKFSNGEVITVEVEKQERQKANGCDNPAKVCAKKQENGCWRWTYGHLDSLHSISGNGFCVDCCKSGSNTGDLCPCKDLTTFEKIEECLDVGANGTCPEGFLNVCGKCLADLSNKPLPACNGSCPKDRYLCGDECWPTWMKNNLLVCPSTGKCQYKYARPAPPCDGSCLRENSFLCGDECWPDYYKTSSWGRWVCNGKCQSKSTPCDETLCPEGSFLCGSKCVPNSNERYYQFCDGQCISIRTPCNGQCSNGLSLCGNERCIQKPSYYWWSCGDKCQPKRTPCDGKCFNGYTLCGTDRCVPTTSLSWYRTCGDKCIQKRAPCNGTCIDGLTLCNMWGRDWCYNPKRIWDCNGNCQYLHTPCNGRCPIGYINCNGWCRSAYYFKQCNGQCIYSRDNCIDKCQVGDSTLKVGETLEYPEKCMMLNCTTKYNDRWRKTAVLESGNMGDQETGLDIAGCSQCKYDGVWKTSKGKIEYTGSTATGSCSIASTKTFRMKNVFKKKMNLLQRKVSKK